MSAVKDDLISAVQTALEKAGVTDSKKSVETYLAAVLEGILTTCREKQSVRTSLGTFRWAHTDARQRINPRNKTEVSVPAYSTLKFKVAKGVRINDAVPEVEVAPVVEAPVTKASTPKTVAKMVASRTVKKK